MKNNLNLLLCVVILFGNNSIADKQMNDNNIIDLDLSQLEAVELYPVEDYPFMKVIDGDEPLAGGVTSFQSNDGKFDVGSSRYSKITLRLSDWPVDEFMYFLEGEVEITNEDGSSKIYGPGDAIVMPKGFNGIWRQLTPIKKINISYPME